MSLPTVMEALFYIDVHMQALVSNMRNGVVLTDVETQSVSSMLNWLEFVRDQDMRNSTDSDTVVDYKWRMAAGSANFRRSSYYESEASKNYGPATK